MSTTSAAGDRRFYRDSDRAKIGGVCAGIARHLGLNLCVTRVLAIIAFFTAMPFAAIAYIATVFLVPARSSGEYREVIDRKPRRKRRERFKDETIAAADAQQRADLVKRRCREIDERLITLEKVVTSRRFQLDQELRRL